MLHVSLLGEQAITDDASGIVRAQSSRTVALIAYLVAHAGAPQPRQRIAGLFWPGSTDRQALTNLRRELHNLRHVLGDDPSLVVTSKDLCWRDAETCRVDVRTFALERTAALTAGEAGDSDAALAHATAALAQYRGELLPGVYDEWLLDVRAELEDQCVEVCDLICDVQQRTDDPTVAVAAARRRIALRPLEEIGYRTLMRLQADLGDRAGAVSTYHHCASVLERELGVDPDPATRTLFQSLLAPAHAAGRPPQRTGRFAGRSGFLAVEFVGRTREFGLGHDVWRTAAAGRPSLVLVHGDAGVGKTRLVAEISQRAQQDGAVVAWTRCFGTAARLALAPVADWLRHPAVQTAMPGLDPIWRTEVSRLVPLGSDRGSVRASSRAMVDAWQRHRFFEGLARALLAVRRPMVLVLDNLHWCDQESLALLTFLLRLTPDAPLLVAGTLRDDSRDDDPELAAWTAGMSATGLLTEISLPPLDAADTAHLAETIVGRTLPDEVSSLLYATTGGFPLHVVEAARSVADVGEASSLPSDLTAVLRHRLEQASPTAGEVAGLASAVGRNFTLDLLTEASDLEAGTVVRAVDELWRRRIVREFRDGYDFSHDLLRAAAYDRVSPPRRWLLHRRIAQALELLHPDDTEAVSVQLAQQYARAGRADRAVAYYRRAADVAASLFAHAEAIRLHREALAIVGTLPEGREADRHELAVLQAMAAPLTARHGYASAELQPVLERSVELAERVGGKDATVSGLVSLWASRFVQGRMADAQRTATRALTLIEPDSELSGPAHFACGGSAVTLGSPEQAVHHFKITAARTRGAALLSVGTRPDVHSRAWAAHAHWLLGHEEAALSNCQDAVALARAIDHPYSLAVALAYAGITYQMRRDLAELGDAASELGDLCERYGFAYYREWGLILRAWCDSDASRVDRAHQGIGNLKADSAFARMPYWLSLLADLLARDGRPGTAAATLDAALIAGQTRADVWWLPEVQRMRAAYDDQDAAVVRLRSAAAVASDHGSVALLRRCEADLAERAVR